MLISEDEYEHWLAYVDAFSAAFQCEVEKSGILAGISPGNSTWFGKTGRGGRIVICAPHPDDEVLFGALPLRLSREQGCGVTVLAVTLGSNRERKAARAGEAGDACALLGFDLVMADDQLAPLSPYSRGQDPKGWQRRVEYLVDFFAQSAPDMVLYPHDLDGHPTHIATSYLVHAALLRHTASGSQPLFAVECEYWQPMVDPNLLVGIGREHAATLLAALVCHRGEMSRNPYHLREPARMMDNVRRGGEALRGFGLQSPAFPFGVLYRMNMVAGGVIAAAERGLIATPAEEISLEVLSRLFGNGFNRC